MSIETYLAQRSSQRFTQGERIPGSLRLKSPRGFFLQVGAGQKPQQRIGGGGLVQQPGDLRLNGGILENRLRYRGGHSLGERGEQTRGGFRRRLLQELRQRLLDRRKRKKTIQGFGAGGRLFG